MVLHYGWTITFNVFSRSHPQVFLHIFYGAAYWVKCILDEDVNLNLLVFFQESSPFVAGKRFLNPHPCYEKGTPWSSSLGSAWTVISIRSARAALWGYVSQVHGECRIGVKGNKKLSQFHFSGYKTEKKQYIFRPRKKIFVFHVTRPTHVKNPRPKKVFLTFFRPTDPENFQKVTWNANIFFLCLNIGALKHCLSA